MQCKQRPLLVIAGSVLALSREVALLSVKVISCDLFKKYSEIRGQPIGIGRIVIVRVPVRVDIAEVRRVVVIS